MLFIVKINLDVVSYAFFETASVIKLLQLVKLK